MKICARCKERKSFEEFGVNTKSSDGHKSWCKHCYREYHKQRDKNIKRVYTAEQQRKWNMNHFYSMTPERFEEILIEQDGCAICHEWPVEGGRNFSVDHDHTCCQGKRTCGKCIRGILCHGCNVAMGLLCDDIQRIRNAERYITNFALGKENK